MANASDIVARARRTGTLDGLPDGLFLDGAFRPAVSGARMESFDPGRASAFASFASGGADDVDAAVESAKKAFETVWRDTAPAGRGRILARAAQLIREQADRLAVAESLDSGKTLSEARGDVGGAARCFEYYAGACDKIEGRSLPLGADYLGYTLAEPVGVTAHIIPWNYPLSTAARGLAPALAAGCTVVAKPAETTPFTALMLAEILSQAGLPDGACNVVTGTGAQAGAPLVAHADINQVTFTGSVATGQSVMRSAADHVTRLVLELGGKSPVIVLSDCDREAALSGVMGAIFENAGQICSAGSRLVIERSIADGFVAELVARAARLTIGHGLDDPDMGAINSAGHLAKVTGFLDRARTRGAEILTGGTPTVDPETGKGWFFEPTIVGDRPADDELVQEEIFGPVLTVQIAEDADHALALANGTRYGLVAGIYTSGFGTAHRLARRLEAGQVFINEYFAGGIEAPFGGTKFSGFGREKGLEGLLGYCRTKSVAARL
ncbi:aldehyde dehydrogenase (NAD+) [Breoghania corrubedonensis]|uniref:Aldehyde dehydrogenase (NAD+) n=1 Tax=Breoghania corrubedonensis TaxID=665038 RepID=A0A2T5VGG4_9HYPH|nr:aldehyde dehydrogenase family protein [Breoghania corrubedonensis]PTW62806.1 aldehyde dehydrogenase (NAD+) [Breoghania corrubedonensis]